MEDKKEVQGTIGPVNNNVFIKATDDEFYSLLRIASPGTNFRAGLDGALRIGKGALIVVENEKVLPMLDGGFRVNCKFTPQKLTELTKMDGAIVLSRDLKKILFVNVLLTPDSKIKTNETGTRHKAAERAAKQAGTLVIAISERKNEITMFYKNLRYPLRNTDELLRKASTYVQLLEKQRELFDYHTSKLNSSELHNYPSVNLAINVLQKGKLILKIAEELKKYIFELGSESTILKMRVREITFGVDKEINMVMKDYTNLDLKRSKEMIDQLSYDDILDGENILKILAQDSMKSSTPVKGWRLLSKTSLSDAEVASILKDKSSLGEVIYSNIKAYSNIIGDEKARIFKEEIERIKLNSGSL
jgi:diadenylate cyclase